LAEADDYLAAIDRALNHASGIGDVDLVIYNAGMDPINAEVGANQLAERERRVAEWAAAAEVPLTYLLAGGYLWGGFDWDDIVALHRLTIDTFVN
jgi:acetoin utilization deacetylase AcuC-like enzyme